MLYSLILKFPEIISEIRTSCLRNKYLPYDISSSLEDLETLSTNRLDTRCAQPTLAVFFFFNCENLSSCADIRAKFRLSHSGIQTDGLEQSPFSDPKPPTLFVLMVEQRTN